MVKPNQACISYIIYHKLAPQKRYTMALQLTVLSYPATDKMQINALAMFDLG